MLFSGIGADAPYLAVVLPGAAVFGLGMATTVAPLVTTVFAAVDSGRAGMASGVNNVVARIAGLLAVALLPLAAGMSGTGLAGARRRARESSGGRCCWLRACARRRRGCRLAGSAVPPPGPGAQTPALPRRGRQERDRRPCDARALRAQPPFRDAWGHDSHRPTGQGPASFTRLER